MTLNGQNELSVGGDRIALSQGVWQWQYQRDAISYILRLLPRWGA
jgi:hypothetical protein